MDEVIGFPNNIINVLDEFLPRYMPDHDILTRPLRHTDPARSLGIFLVDWVPKLDSQEIGHREPTLSVYNIRIQNLVKHSNEVEGKALFSFDAKTLRAVLYRDNDLTLRLSELIEELIGTRESSKRWGVGRQRFLTNELSGQFVQLGQTEFWLETETTLLRP